MIGSLTRERTFYSIKPSHRILDRSCVTSIKNKEDDDDTDIKQQTGVRSRQAFFTKLLVAKPLWFQACAAYFTGFALLAQVRSRESGGHVPGSSENDHGARHRLACRGDPRDPPTVSPECLQLPENPLWPRREDTCDHTSRRQMKPLVEPPRTRGGACSHQ